MSELSLNGNPYFWYNCCFLKIAIILMCNSCGSGAPNYRAQAESPIQHIGTQQRWKVKLISFRAPFPVFQIGKQHQPDFCRNNSRFSHESVITVCSHLPVFFFSVDTILLLGSRLCVGGYFRVDPSPSLEPGSPRQSHVDLLLPLA